jgi:sterol desaturase/sphingolipid hydroxylase (fatty acid hydroxylase superfamily)
MSALLQSEVGIRMGCFAVVFAAMALWELLAPCRRLSIHKPPRWGSNLGLFVLNSLLLRLVAPLGAVGAAYLAQENAWGLFNRWETPYEFALLLSIVSLDLVVYLQHVMFHAVPLFWRFHLVHHADLDFDITTGLRFHTVEILLSWAIKSAAILLLGPPAAAVIGFEVLLNATSMFNHGNVQLPRRVDSLFRWIVVTPDMHRVHHSWEHIEMNCNFGFNFPWWDRLFSTYRDQPRDGHLDMTVGLKQIRDETRAERLPGMLSLPFTASTTDSEAINEESTSEANDGRPRNH